MNNKPKSRPIQDEREPSSDLLMRFINHLCGGSAQGYIAFAKWRNKLTKVSPPAAQPEPLKHEPLEWGTHCPAAPDRGPHECAGGQACVEKHTCLRCGVSCLCPSCNHGEPRVRSSVSERWIHMRTDIGRAVCIDPPVDPAQPELPEKWGSVEGMRPSAFDGSRPLTEDDKLGFTAETMAELAQPESQPATVKKFWIAHDDAGELFIEPTEATEPDSANVYVRYADYCAALPRRDVDLENYLKSLPICEELGCAECDNEKATATHAWNAAIASKSSQPTTDVLHFNLEDRAQRIAAAGALQALHEAGYEAIVGDPVACKVPEVSSQVAGGVGGEELIQEMLSVLKEARVCAFGSRLMKLIDNAIAKSEATNAKT